MEIKKLRAPRASHYADIEVDLDADGSTLVLEFPADAAFAMQMAEEPDMRDMLKIALASVLGFVPPFRFQLGRGAVRPEPVAVQAPPAVEVDEAPPAPEPEDEKVFSAATGEPKSELERLLTHDLGGQIIGEHAAPSADDGSAEDDVEIEDDTDSADLGQDGPGLFDTEEED